MNHMRYATANLLVATQQPGQNTFWANVPTPSHLNVGPRPYWAPQPMEPMPNISFSSKATGDINTVPLMSYEIRRNEPEATQTTPSATENRKTNVTANNATSNTLPGTDTTIEQLEISVPSRQDDISGTDSDVKIRNQISQALRQATGNKVYARVYDGKTFGGKNLTINELVHIVDRFKRGQRCPDGFVIQNLDFAFENAAAL